MSYKTTDGLMRHLRDNGITISGSTQKRQLINTGYFHGYKGYRFFRTATNRIPFRSFDEIYKTIQYDSALKSLLYSKVMFIETAVKNVALEAILKDSKSENIQTIINKSISSYSNAPTSATEDEKKKLQLKKLNLQKSIQAGLLNAYQKGYPKITHFYHNGKYSDVPIWALFEIMSLGDFGHLLSCLNYNVRDEISLKFGINILYDSHRQLLFQYVYYLKDLRNAIAHNLVIFDTRFRSFDPNSAMKQFLKTEIGVPYMNFKTLGDYIILVCFFLKKLHVSKTELKAFIREFERITEEYRSSVSAQVSSMILHPDLAARMTALKNYI